MELITGTGCPARSTRGHRVVVWLSCSPEEPSAGEAISVVVDAASFLMSAVPPGRDDRFAANAIASTSDYQTHNRDDVAVVVDGIGRTCAALCEEPRRQREADSDVSNCLSMQRGYEENGVHNEGNGVNEANEVTPWAGAIARCPIAQWMAPAHGVSSFVSVHFVFVFDSRSLRCIKVLPTEAHANTGLALP